MYYNTNEFIILKNTCIEYNNPAYTDRFLKLVNDIKSQVRYELEFNMSQIRRIVTGFSFVFMVIILILGIFIKMKSLKITEGLLFLIIAGIQFLTTRLKKNLIQIIVISSIAFVLFLLSLILI